MSEHNGSHRSIVVSSLFGFGFLVGLGNNGSHRSIISSTCELDTGTGWESIPLRSSLSRVSLSLNTVVVGEVDELEEDASPVLKVSLRLKDENWRKNSMTALEPRSERSSPHYILLESRCFGDVVFDR